MSITLIAALDRNHAIGRAGELPWHLPDDLARFKTLTFGKPVLMGRKTAEAIGRPLPGRENLVLTRGANAPFVGQRAVRSVDQARAMADMRELCVIGGGEVYRLTLPIATQMRLTWIDTEVIDADAFFPPFTQVEWSETSRSDHAADLRHEFPFSFADYQRR